jgi:hypothetical protein
MAGLRALIADRLVAWAFRLDPERFVSVEERAR